MLGRLGRGLLPASTALVLLLMLPVGALAHGIAGRTDLPVPIGMFYWAAGAVLIVSFVGLAIAWSRPRWGDDSWRPAPRWLDRLATSPLVLWAGRMIVLGLFLLTFAAAAVGTTTAADNLAPIMVFVVWWLGIVLVAVLFGNLWRALNPWATMARLLRMPERRAHRPAAHLGVWPAVAVLLAFTWLELVYPAAANVRLIAALIAGYSVITLAGMYRYGIEEWLSRGEGFTVYTTVMASLSPFELRHEHGRTQLGMRPPVIGATRLATPAGMVPFIGLLIGTVSFDGFSRSGWWTFRSAEAVGRLAGIGIDATTGRLLVWTIGFAALILAVLAAFELASWLAARAGSLTQHLRGGNVSQRFVHSLVPIALAYVVAHYFSYFVFQSQAATALASDPFGTGADIFGTAGSAINYDLLTANMIWYVQVGSIAAGHVLGLMLAHDQALRLAPDARAAVRSQYPMLALMVVYTVGGLWFLSEGLS